MVFIQALAGSVLETTETNEAYDVQGQESPKKPSWIDSEPTLRRTWSGECSRPQCAFEVSMIYVFCNSH
jgi:hypothetical protein